MRERGFTRALAIISLLIGSGLAAAPALAQGATDHWLGWYAGGTVGVAWTEVDIAVPPNTFSSSYSSIAGGIVGGNNFYVTDQFLVGLEADLTFADLAGGMTLARHKASLLARIGWFGSPSTLFFGVVGLAGGQYAAKVTATTTTTQITFDSQTEQQITVTNTVATSTKRNKRLWGYTLGAGFENQGTLGGLDIRWGMEYRFTDFKEWNFAVTGQPFSIDPQVHELRFRFVVPLQQFFAP